MTDDELTLAAIKGVIFDLPESERKLCETTIAELREIINRNPTFGTLAIALLGAEMQLANVL